MNESVKCEGARDPRKMEEGTLLGIRARTDLGSVRGMEEATTTILSSLLAPDL